MIKEKRGKLPTKLRPNQNSFLTQKWVVTHNLRNTGLIIQLNGPINKLTPSHCCLCFCCVSLSEHTPPSANARLEQLSVLQPMGVEPLVKYAGVATGVFVLGSCHFATLTSKSLVYISPAGMSFGRVRASPTAQRQWYRGKWVGVKMGKEGGGEGAREPVA